MNKDEFDSCDCCQTLTPKQQDFVDRAVDVIYYGSVISLTVAVFVWLSQRKLKLR